MHTNTTTAKSDRRDHTEAVITLDGRELLTVIALVGSATREAMQATGAWTEVEDAHIEHRCGALFTGLTEAAVEMGLAPHLLTRPCVTMAPFEPESYVEPEDSEEAVAHDAEMEALLDEEQRLLRLAPSLPPRAPGGAMPPPPMDHSPEGLDYWGVES